MKRRTKRLLQIGVPVVVLLGFLAVVYFGFLQSALVLGEEGYSSYDPLLAAGSWDTSKWVLGTATITGACKGSATGCTGANAPDVVHGVPPSAVSVDKANNRIWLGSYTYTSAARPPQPGGAGAGMRTVDLRLVNMRFEFVAAPAWYYNGYAAFLYTNRGLVTTVTTTSTGVVSSSIELTWDDYALGHYQVKANGVVVQEGNVSDSDQLYFYVVPDGVDYTGVSHAVGFQNPRVKNLFGCSLGAGEYLVGVPFSSGQSFNVGNLRGFERFCLDTPALTLNGSTLGSSKDIYYAVAEGQTVTTGDNQIVKVFYIGNGTAVGLSSNQCVGAAYDYTKKSCTSLTGFADFCPAGQFLSNGACVVQVQASPVVLSNESRIVGDNQAFWTANYQHASLMSDGYVLVDTAPPVYTCQATDNHIDFSAVNYPRPNASCYRFSADGQTLDPASDNALSEFWTLRVSGTPQVRVYYDSSKGLSGDYQRPSDWQVPLTATLVKRPFVVSVAALQGYVLGSNESFAVSVQNGLGAVDAVVETVFTDSVGTTQAVQLVWLRSGANSFRVPVNAAHVGQASAQVIVLLVTDAGTLQGSDAQEFAYAVQTGQAFCPAGAVWNDATSQCEKSVTVLTTGQVTCDFGLDLVTQGGKQVCVAPSAPPTPAVVVATNATAPPVAQPSGVNVTYVALGVLLIIAIFFVGFKINGKKKQRRGRK